MTARQACKTPGRFSLPACVAGLSLLLLLPAVAGARTLRAPNGSTEPRLTWIAAAPGSGTEVMLANADGSGARALGPADTAVISPGGALVAAVRPRTGSAHGSALVVYTTGARTVTRVLRTSASQLT
ncbi:MAG TPA: hypothetical protein VL977_06355, partial [Solirubrobacteraceae bacterium]|nr:hypothetical protein [Solirubrobacteraceae bacterium]